MKTIIDDFRKRMMVREHLTQDLLCGNALEIADRVCNQALELINENRLSTHDENTLMIVASYFRYKFIWKGEKYIEFTRNYIKNNAEFDVILKDLRSGQIELIIDMILGEDDNMFSNLFQDAVMFGEEDLDSLLDGVDDGQ